MIDDAREWATRYGCRLVDSSAPSSGQGVQNGEDYHLQQGSERARSHQAAKIYLQAWAVSWHQLHNEDAKTIALWSYEDLQRIAAMRNA